jgi:hypothetical protein
MLAGFTYAGYAAIAREQSRQTVHKLPQQSSSVEEDVMSPSTRRIVLGGFAFLEHAAAVIVLGLGLGVTMLMLPVGVVVGLIGVLLVVGGLFARINSRTT